jgi:xylitol oxidase
VKNWAGNHVFRARGLLEPASVDELQQMIAASESVRPIGTRYSFNDLADTDGDLISVAGLPRVLQIDGPTRTVSVDGGARFGEICEPLHRAGWALHNLPSLPHISIAGACATGTHGSGDRSPILADAVVGLDLVRADGELVHVGGPGGQEDIPLEAAAVSLGALGVVVALQLRIEPTYLVRQDVFEHLPVDRFEEALAHATTMADSVSFFTAWQPGDIDQVWLKRRIRDGEPEPPALSMAGARPATRNLHPIRALSAAACTPQLGVAGPWHERLPHFRMTHTPSSGEELQSEYFVAREDAVAAFEALLAMRERLAPLVLVSEIRTIAADSLWLSPAFGRASVAFHFTWRADPAGVMAVLPEMERALEPFEPRPHWAKLSTLPSASVRSRFPKLGAFATTARHVDPAGKFGNRRLRDLLGS